MNKLFLPVMLLPMREIVRALLKLPFTKRFMWSNVYKLRRFFAAHVRADSFVTRFDRDIKINVSLSDHIESQVFWQEVQEGDRGEVKFLKSLLAPSHTFIDVGGNIGVFSLIAAKRLTAGMVHTFEPSALHLKKLRANLLLNRFPNVHVHPVALSNQPSRSKLYFLPRQAGSLTNTGMASQFPFNVAPDRIEEITCTKLDDYRQSSFITSVDVIKIDVEGAELDVLFGAIETIRSYRPHVVMEVSVNHLQRARRSLQELIDYWGSLQYRIFRIGHDADLILVNSVPDFVEDQNIYCDPGERP